MTASRPNLLLILSDQHRADWLGSNPELPLRTPTLDALGRVGTRFSNAVTPSPICAPARACMLTGKHYRACGVPDNKHSAPVSTPNYVRALRQAGYEVAAVGKLDLRKPERDWGTDGTRSLGLYGFSSGLDCEGKGDAILSYLQNGRRPQGPYMAYLEREGLLDRHLAMYEGRPDADPWLNFPADSRLPQHAYSDNWIADQARRRLLALPKGEPWHLMVSFAGPHPPYDVTEAMYQHWRTVDFPAPYAEADPPDPATPERRRRYAAMIENIDRQIARLLDALRERGEFENTIVLYTSDHGEMLGDHGRWSKGHWRQASTRIPMIVGGPGVASGESDAVVGLHDVAATLLEYAGASELKDVDARSLRPVLERRREAVRDFMLSGYRQWDTLFDGRHKLVRGPDGRRALFDLREDPQEDHDLAASRSDEVRRLDQLMSKALEAG